VPAGIRAAHPRPAAEVNGLGSVRGALVGSLLIGQVESVGRALLPDLASVVLFGALAMVLVVRPRGLFGARA